MFFACRRSLLYTPASATQSLPPHHIIGPKYLWYTSPYPDWSAATVPTNMSNILTQTTEVPFTLHRAVVLHRVGVHHDQPVAIVSHISSPSSPQSVPHGWPLPPRPCWLACSAAFSFLLIWKNTEWSNLIRVSLGSRMTAKGSHRN